MQDTHPYTISVARDKNFQNMEFLDNKSLKPYESQVKPLAAMVEVVSWATWNDIEHARQTQRCALDRTHAIFTQ